MVKRIAAVVLGIVAAVALVALVQAISHAVFPTPAGVDLNDPAQLEDHIQGMPVAAFLLVLASYLLGTLGGGLLACLIAKEKPFVFASIIGGFVLAATIANLIMLPHPLWFSATAIIAIVAMTYVTGLVASSVFGR